MRLPPRSLARRTPFFYGWVVFGLASAMSLVRPVMSVAVLSVFLVPMTVELGWSRGLFSGAVSLGGVAGAQNSLITIQPS